MSAGAPAVAQPVYKILRPAEWQMLQDSGRLDGSPDDRRDGFIHLSTAAQLHGTLDKHFVEDSAVMILEIDAARLGDGLRWEPSRGGALFPHLYRPLAKDDVVAARPMTKGPGGRWH